MSNKSIRMLVSVSLNVLIIVLGIYLVFFMGSKAYSFGEKIFNEEKKQRPLIRNERVYGTFTRSFTLHEEANPDLTSAEFENGILKIAIGKASHKTVKERQINIK